MFFWKIFCNKRKLKLIITVNRKNTAPENGKTTLLKVKNA